MPSVGAEVDLAPRCVRHAERRAPLLLRVSRKAKLGERLGLGVDVGWRPF